jgi:putative oxidoreductase
MDTHLHDAKRYLVPAGRALFSAIFLSSALGHFAPRMIHYAAAAGVPMPNLLVPASGVLALLGGLSILLGLRARIGAALVALFLVPVTFMMHAFWNVHEPAAAAMQQVNFLKNLGLLGGAALLGYTGSGPVSVDAWLGQRHTPHHTGGRVHVNTHAHA